jgi:hypothetical protein
MAGKKGPEEPNCYLLSLFPPQEDPLCQRYCRSAMGDELENPLLGIEKFRSEEIDLVSASVTRQCKCAVFAA